MDRDQTMRRFLTRLSVLMLLCCAVVAQQVRVANHLHLPFDGWVRTTVDERPAHAAGVLPDGTRFVLGRRVGLDTWAVDLHLTLEPRELRTLDLATAAAAPSPALPLPADPLGHFGGWASIGGVPMSIVGLEVDGAAWDVHLRARVGRTFVCDAWLVWRPEEPWLATGEVVLTSSNPAVRDVLETAPPGGLAFLFGDGMVFGSQVAASGERFADGQVRAVPIVVGWPRHAPDAVRWLSTVPAAVGLSTCAVGISKLWAQGNPRLMPGLDPQQWTKDRWPLAVARSRTWEDAVTGPNRNSADSGVQGDQVFVAGECMAGVGPEKVAYLSSLKLMARPCHHMRADGTPVDPNEVLGVQFWHGRPHEPSTHNLLGKARGIEAADASGWWGPDSEHWLYNTLAVAARVSGSRALQWELSNQARLFLMSQVLPGPGHEFWITAGPDASRAVGWTMLLADHLWRNLEDRALAERVKQRAIGRVQQVYVPAFAGRDFWDVRTDDPRLGSGPWWIAWQQSVGCYGLDVVSERFGLQEGRAVALRAARAVLRDAWKLVGGRWLSQPQRPVVGDTLRDESFNYFGMALSVAVVLRHEPENAQARAIWQQLLESAHQPGDWSWLAPEVQM